MCFSHYLYLSLSLARACRTSRLGCIDIPRGIEYAQRHYDHPAAVFTRIRFDQAKARRSRALFRPVHVRAPRVSFTLHSVMAIS